MKVLVMGSFDPITKGHLYIIDEAIKLADTVNVCIMINDKKTPRFDTQDRLNMIKIAISHKCNVVVDSYNGMCCDYCKANDIDIIVRGYRNSNDYIYEREMAEFNRDHCGVETVLIAAQDSVASFSSSNVKANLDKSEMNDALPPGVYEYIIKIKK